MHSPDAPWYRHEPPSDDEIKDAWIELFDQTAKEFEQWLPPKSPAMKFLKRRRPVDLYASITTPVALREEQEDSAIEHVFEMPSFSSSDESNEATEKEWESDDEGGLALIDSGFDIHEKSRLLLTLQIRNVHREVMRVGIMHHRFNSLILPHRRCMAVVKRLTTTTRDRFADILLFQFAQDVKEDLSGDADEWMKLQTVIDQYLDMPNMREFHSRIKNA